MAVKKVFKLEEALAALVSEVKALGEKIEKLDKISTFSVDPSSTGSTAPVVRQLPLSPPEPAQYQPPPQAETGIPIPVDWRRTVDEVLNPEFGLAVSYRSDQPLFEITITVPDRYSTMSPLQKTLNKVDRRVRVIPNAEGVLGVRQYAELVFNSFDNQIKSMIVADRNRIGVPVT